MVGERSDRREATGTPTAVRVASGLLVVVLVGGAIGIALISRHVLGALQDENVEQQAGDLAVLIERILQWMAAAVALWAIRRRRRLGRWLTATMAMYLAIKVISGFWGAAQAMLGQVDAVSKGQRFSTPAEGLGGVLFAGAIASGLIAIAFSMAFAAPVREYFDSARSS